MQRDQARRLSPRMVLVALTSAVMVLSALAVSQADIGSPQPVSVATLAGDTAAAPLPADVLPGEDLAAAEAAPESPPTTAAPSTTTTSGTSARTTATVAKIAAPPCPKTASEQRPCPPPCAQPAPANCPPPCAQPASPSPATPAAPPPGAANPSRAACPPPPCGAYDTASGTAYSCPQPCPAFATTDGKPAPCPPPPPPPPPPPCAYPTEPDGGIGNSTPAIMISCSPPCERDASCPQPCYEAKPMPESTPSAGGTDPVPPSQSCPPPPCPGAKDCPPPCPSAAATDQSCTPPCSYEPAGGSAAGAFAPCPAPSGVEGRVTAGPTCPVERPDQPCADKPVETTLRLLRKDGSVAATTKSGPDGTFKMAVAPGSYRLVADWPSRIGGCGPVEVTVERGRFTHADVSCDTGIR